MARLIFDQLAPISSYYWRNDVIGKFSTGSIGHNLLAGVEIGRQYASYDQAATLFSAINIFNPVYGAPVPARIEHRSAIVSRMRSAGTRKTRSRCSITFMF